MFLISNPALVIAQCTSGIIGSLPALNARPVSAWEAWLAEITEALANWDSAHPERPAAPFGVNLIVHRSNPRLEEDLALCEKYRVPLVISSMGAREEVNARVQAYGGATLHDVTTQEHAHKAIEKGANGLIAVAAGAGGHAGRLSPFAFVDELRQWFGGPLVLAGAIGNGRSIAAAMTLGADFAYVGSSFIATTESSAPGVQKQAVIDASAEEIVYTPAFSGTPANYLRSSIVAAGLDPDNLPATRRDLDLGQPDKSIKTWTDIWGCGQGIGSIDAITPAADVINRLVAEYEAALSGAASGARA